MGMGEPIISSNWHITSKCNYGCKFCFAKDLGTEDITNDSLIKRIILHQQQIGVRKINFAGGEPLLHEKLPTMLEYAKSLGMVTSIVTNGSLLDDEMLYEISNWIDWIGVSIDSFDENTELRLGRGNGDHVCNSLKVMESIRNYGIKLKINSTITSLNYLEDMSNHIILINPDRWKVFQYLPILGQNEQQKDLMISTEMFDQFVMTNSRVSEYGINAVFERNDVMIGSYVIISPDGTILDNITGTYVKREHILDLDQLQLPHIINIEKYHGRDAEYFVRDL